jgi:hypothetical protein
MESVTQIVLKLLDTIDKIAQPVTIFLGLLLVYWQRKSAQETERLRIQRQLDAQNVKEVKATLELKTEEDRRIAQAADRKFEVLAKGQAVLTSGQNAQIELLREAKEVSNGQTRAFLQTIATMKREQADRTLDPKHIEAAEEAERKLRQHDEQQAALSGMSGDSLRTFISEKGSDHGATE